MIGKAEHYFTKSKIAQFLVEKGNIAVGDPILISGPTTGEQQLTLSEIFANGQPAQAAEKGDQITFAVPFRVRLSDQLYKILS